VLAGLLIVVKFAFKLEVAVFIDLGLTDLVGPRVEEDRDLRAGLEPAAAELNRPTGHERESTIGSRAARHTERALGADVDADGAEIHGDEPRVDADLDVDGFAVDEGQSLALGHLDDLAIGSGDGLRGVRLVGFDVDDLGLGDRRGGRP